MRSSQLFLRIALLAAATLPFPRLAGAEPSSTVPDSALADGGSPPAGQTSPTSDDAPPPSPAEPADGAGTPAPDHSAPETDGGIPLRDLNGIGAPPVLPAPPPSDSGAAAPLPSEGPHLLPAAPSPPVPVLPPGLQAGGRPPPPAAAQAIEQHAAAANGPKPAAALGEPKFPDDTPPVSNNEFSLEVGWNSDAPMGARYLRRIEGTGLFFGAGLGAYTVWGPKLSVIVRYQRDQLSGWFAQADAGFTLGNTFTQKVTPPGEAAQTAHFIRTPGRTADLALGWRFPVLGSFLEASAGYAFNLAGTVLQDATQSTIPINPKWITFAQAGGPAASVAYGWLF